MFAEQTAQFRLAKHALARTDSEWGETTPHSELDFLPPPSYLIIPHSNKAMGVIA